MIPMILLVLLASFPLLCWLLVVAICVIAYKVTR